MDGKTFYDIVRLSIGAPVAAISLPIFIRGINVNEEIRESNPKLDELIELRKSKEKIEAKIDIIQRKDLVSIAGGDDNPNLANIRELTKEYGKIEQKYTALTQDPTVVRGHERMKDNVYEMAFSTGGILISALFLYEGLKSIFGKKIKNHFQGRKKKSRSLGTGGF